MWTDEILAIVFPITAFVAIGFEHSIANFFFPSFGLAVDAHSEVSIAGVGRNTLAKRWLSFRIPGISP